MNERITFKKHLFFSISDGLVRGAFALSQFIFLKTLGGSELMQGILFQFSMVTFLFAVPMGGIMQRAYNKRKLLRITALATQTPMLLFALFELIFHQNYDIIYHLLFLLIFFIYFLSQPIILPTINQVLKQNYEHQHYARLFGYATAIKQVAFFTSFALFSYWLHCHESHFVYMYVLVGAISIIALFITSTIPYTPSATEINNASQKLSQSVSRALVNFVRILRKNRPFRDLQIGFMIYGLAWMASEAVIPIFFEKQLNLNYVSFGFYRNAHNFIAIFLLPIFGKLLGKIDPRKFGYITFGSLALYLLFTMLAAFLPYNSAYFDVKIYWIMIPAILFNGLFTSTMPLLWGIGSSFFCKTEEAGEYQSIHLTLVGARALLGPVLGVVFYQTWDYKGAFILSITLLAIAILFLRYSIKHAPLNKE